MIISIFVITCIGFLASVYSFIVEQKIKHNPTYKPICNLSDKISCSKPILSPYGKIIGISNSVVGMCFYLIIALLALIHATMIIFGLALCSCLASIYLAWILYTRIKALCLICITIYLINGLLLIFSYLNL